MQPEPRLTDAPAGRAGDPDRDRPPRRVGKSAGRPAGSDSAETRAEILRAARDGFAQRGYDAASVRDLAAAAGITVPSVYHHFGPKAALFAAAYRDAEGTVQEVLADAVEGVTGFADRLGAMVDALGELHVSDPTIAAMMSVGQVETSRSPELAAARLALGADVESVLPAVIDDAVASGELAADVDRGAVLGVLLAVTLGAALFASMAPPDDVAALMTHWRLLMTGELIQRPASP